MAKFWGSYIKYLISEHDPLVRLIHQHGGLDLERLTDEEIDAALHQPFSRLVREALRSLHYYLRTHSELMNAHEASQALLNYLSQALPIVQLNRDELFGEARSQLTDLHKALSDQFEEMIHLNFDRKQAINDLEENYSILETFADETFEKNFTFRLLILQEIYRELEKQGMSLSESEQSDFFEDMSWNQMIHTLQKNQILAPPQVNLENPQYSDYFELKRCIAIAKVRTQQSGPLSGMNDAIHPDTLSKIQRECAIEDKVTEIIFSQFNEFCQNMKDRTHSQIKTLSEKRSVLLELNQQALALSTVVIPDAKPLMKIAKETLANDISFNPNKQQRRLA